MESVAALQTVLPTDKRRRRLLFNGLFIAMFITIATGAAAAQSGSVNQIEDTFTRLGNILAWFLVLAAVPNGFYGFFQLMTAGSSVERDEAGRKRIRNTLIGLAGAAIVAVSVRLIDNTLNIGNPGGSGGGGGGGNNTSTTNSFGELGDTATSVGADVADTAVTGSMHVVDVAMLIPV